MPDDVRKINGVMRYNQGTSTDGFTLSGMAYSNAWNSTDQVAQRAIDQGVVDRLGSRDPTDGGVSSRFSLSGNFAHSSEFGQTNVTAYVIRSDLQLYNNFTYFLDNPVNGDQFNQLDRRTITGFDARHSFDRRFAGLETQTRIGFQSRIDHIQAGLFQDRATQLAFDCARGSCGGTHCRDLDRHYHTWTDWLRTTFGICEDLVSGRVLSNTLENSGNAQASMASPKGAVVLGPWFKTEFYSNAGYGLHSNDIRGATITVDPTYNLTPLDRVPLLVRSRGAEVGVRTKAIESLTSSFAIFVLDFDSELLFVGDAGTTEPTEPARRRRMGKPVQAGALVVV